MEITKEKLEKQLEEVEIVKQNTLLNVARLEGRISYIRELLKQLEISQTAPEKTEKAT